ncbi:Uncharacterised protein family (UPF0041) [Babesia microti strain RI]|uniref:Mitochondrial pyruvate carrier n=1 Tax=Babesia microti (strain RI) TaxID=1133968 RepID=A0A0K3ASN7_BABMR|nr:Uncharacterised protein family (UPF0041) [Babesia microti strain RI]CTQ41470.1 Uncharacterised protein family (UPF0041) [Babesia microti strain RI]|eukprot:XP_012649481.1 Uncharacterised protein family (UPF0041) [Babesia microti strain RI]
MGRLGYYGSSHFWGPIANWGFVLAGISDLKKNPDNISKNMSGVLCFYSMLFMRFSIMVKPRNYLLFACHFCNSTIQATQLIRIYNHKPQN